MRILMNVFKDVKMGSNHLIQLIFAGKLVLQITFFWIQLQRNVIQIVILMKIKQIFIQIMPLEYVVINA